MYKFECHVQLSHIFLICRDRLYMNTHTRDVDIALSCSSVAKVASPATNVASKDARALSYDLGMVIGFSGFVARPRFSDSRFHNIT